jgi:hypothetical protein
MGYTFHVDLVMELVQGEASVLVGFLCEGEWKNTFDVLRSDWFDDVSGE